MPAAYAPLCAFMPMAGGETGAGGRNGPKKPLSYTPRLGISAASFA
jgi:hypothetical protein